MVKRLTSRLQGVSDNNQYMNTRTVITLIIFSITLVACESSATDALLSFDGRDAAAHTILVTVPANATPTPTPFLPDRSGYNQMQNSHNFPAVQETPQATVIPPPWGDYPGPKVRSAIAIPPPMERIRQPDGQVNILLLGSDQRPGEGGYRTDVILVLSLNPEAGTASLISIPRDLYVYIPGWAMDRINTVLIRGGFDSLALTIEYNFGFTPDYWVMANFNGFMTIIDTIGGIDVQVAITFTDKRDGYGDYTVTAGTVHMDGETALWYVRARYTSSDFDRNRRQQEVLKAIFLRLLSLDALVRAPELYTQFQNTIQTDMPLGEIIPLLPLAAQLHDMSNLHLFALRSSHVSSWINPYNGAQVLLPNREAVRSIFLQALDSTE